MFRDPFDSMQDVEELRLEDDVVSQIKSELDRIKKYMVEKTKMGDWEIGYLPGN